MQLHVLADVYMLLIISVNTTHPDGIHPVMIFDPSVTDDKLSKINESESLEWQGTEQLCMYVCHYNIVSSS